jgi:tRNA(Leu) C34 or U34 (ribose-2'-O)-methylase TrmL
MAASVASESDRQMPLSSSRAPSSSIVIYNISKRPNVKQLLNAAIAFGCRSIFIVGQRQFRISNRYCTHYESSQRCDHDPSTPDTSQDVGGPRENDQVDDDVPPAIRDYLLDSPGSIQIIRFRKWKDFMAYKEETVAGRCIRLVGIEIHNKSIPVNQDFPINLFEELQTPNSLSPPSVQGIEIAFLLGNEGMGLFPQQIANCEALVRIPQYGAGAASLNVAVAASIILQQFQSWRE